MRLGHGDFSFNQWSLWPRPIRRYRIGHTFILGLLEAVVQRVVMQKWKGQLESPEVIEK
jgi:hypothetical protein